MKSDKTTLEAPSYDRVAFPFSSPQRSCDMPKVYGSATNKGWSNWVEFVMRQESKNVEQSGPVKSIPRLQYIREKILERRTKQQAQQETVKQNEWTAGATAECLRGECEACKQAGCTCLCHVRLGK